MKFVNPTTTNSQIAGCYVTPFKARLATVCWNQYLLAL